MSSIAAVVFDLDDTLYPERGYAFSGFAAVAEAFADRLGDAGQSAERMRRLFDSGHRSRVFNMLLVELGWKEDPALVQEIIEVYRTHHPTIRLFDDAGGMLKKLRPEYRLGLLTDGRSATQRRKIDALGLRERFESILITSELGPGFGKPSPRPFEFISTRLQVVGSRSVYVADNLVKDFAGPNALGWMTVQIRRAEGLYSDQKPVPGGEPSQVIDTLDRLMDGLR